MLIFISKNVKKLNKDKYGFDFASNIDNSKKSLAKVMNNRTEKLSTLLDTNQTQLNVTNISGISIDRLMPNEMCEVAIFDAT